MTGIPNSDFDSPWKEILELYFQDFVLFFFPKAYEDIDWSHGYRFLDKEFQGIVPDAEHGRRVVDKLVKVWRVNGLEEWVLVHIEIQGQPEKNFAGRMYVYNNRIYDRYSRRVASFALLADGTSHWRPDRFEYSLWGTRVLLEYATVKLIDYRQHWDKLEESKSVFAVAVRAHLRALESRGDAVRRRQWKLEVILEMYRSGYEKPQIIALFRFIDWMMRLPDELEQEFWEDLSQFEEKMNMPYITSVERIGISKGLQQGLQQGIEQGLQQGIEQGLQKGREQERRLRQYELQEIALEVLEDRFGQVPADLNERLFSITLVTQLHRLARLAATVTSLDEFAAELNGELGR